MADCAQQARDLLEIVVDPVKVAGSVASYSWQAAPGNGVFRRNSLRIDYEGLDLERLPDDLLYAGLLAAFAGPIASATFPVHVEFPAAVSSELLRLWQVYRSADNLTASPLRDEADWRPTAAHRISQDEVRNVGVLLGGGKDSLFALASAVEVFGADRVKAINYAHNVNGIGAHRLRQRSTLHPEVREQLGVEVVHVATDIRRTFSRDFERRLGLPMYYSTLLPVIVEHDLSILTCSNELTHYWVDGDGTKESQFGFSGFRPEADRFLSSGYSALLGRPFQICNPNFGLSKHLAFKVLANRYPHALKALFMCEATLKEHERWCGQCWKCAEYVFLCLANKLPCAIDVNSFLVESRYVRNLLAAARRNETRLPHASGNCSWLPEIRGAPVHFPTLCHSLHGIDRDWAARNLTSDAFSCLAELVALFGNHRYPVFDDIVPGHFDIAALPYDKALRRILEPYLIANDTEDYSFLAHNRTVTLKPALRLGFPARATVDA